MPRNLEKRRASDRAYRERNGERIRAKDRADYAANPGKFKAPVRAYQARNPEKVAARNTAYRKTHPAYQARAKVRARAWRKANPERGKAKDAAYRKANPEKILASGQRRRAYKAKAPVNDFTAAQWREMQAAYDHRCVYCGKRRKGKLTQDHIQPLSKGGSHTLRNIVPACMSCNSSKCAGPVPVPIQPLLLV